MISQATWLKLSLLALIAVAGWSAGTWVSNSIDARRERDSLKQQLGAAVETAKTVDESLTEKLRTEAAIDAEVGSLQRQRREAESREPSYREYLDRPIPEQSRRLYERAGAFNPAAADPSAPGTDARPDDSDPGDPD